MVTVMAQLRLRAHGKGCPQLSQTQGDISHTHDNHPTCTTAILASPQYNPVDPISTETYRHPHGGQYGTIRDESIWERIPTAIGSVDDPTPPGTVRITPPMPLEPMELNSTAHTTTLAWAAEEAHYAAEIYDLLP